MIRTPIACLVFLGVVFCGPFPDWEEETLLALLYAVSRSPSETRPVYNHPAELLGHWSGRPESDGSYCDPYYHISFYDDYYGWLQKARYYDPVPTVQPCAYFLDYSYGGYGDDSPGYSYYDWNVESGQLCEKLFDNNLSTWTCKTYTIVGDVLTWGSGTYHK